MNKNLDSNPEILEVGQAVIRYDPGWCSGFFVRPDLIATAGHCLRNRHSTNVDIHLRNGELIKGECSVADFGWDIGFIKVSPYSHRQRPLSLDKEQPSFGVEIYNATLMADRNHNGRPFNVEFGKFYGTLPATEKWKTEHFWSTAASKGGYSGAPFIYFGKVVALLVAGNNSGHTFGVPSKYIESLMRKVS